MRRLLPILLLLGTGCAAKHVVPPESPLVKPEIATFDGVRLVMKSFSLRGLSEKDELSDQNFMRQRFLDYLASSNRFTELIDGQTNYTHKGNYHSRPLELELEVSITLDHSAYRTWILDAAGIYPFPGFWPLTPQWGTASVEVVANMRDPKTNLVYTGTYTGEESYSIIWYSWYRTKPVEDAYKIATQVAFDAMAMDLAKKRNEIYAKVADHIPVSDVLASAQPAVTNASSMQTIVPPVQPPPPPPVQTPPAVIGERASWIIAVMEITDTNAGDQKKAVDPQLIRNLSDQLRVFVAQHKVKVIDRGSQERAVRELTQEAKADSYKECFDASCQIPLGKALAASHLLRSQVTRFGAACVLNGELIDLKREVTVAAGSARADCSEEGFLAASETVTTSLLSSSVSGT